MTAAAGAMILVELVARHADEAAQLWYLRDAAVRSPTYDLAALQKLDDRVDAQLDGLRIAGDAGWEAARAGLADPGAGELFTATVLAVERADVESFAELIAQGVRSPERARGVISALGWAPFAQVRRYLDELLGSDAPAELHVLGIAGAAAHRHDPGSRLAEAASSDDPLLQARALRAIGELGRADLLPVLRRRLDAEDEACRFWAAWSAALLGERAAVARLSRLALTEGRFAGRALSLFVRSADPEAARATIDMLAAKPEKLRLALKGAAALGDPALLPWIIEAMRVPDQARLAGWAFTTITGVDLSAHALSTHAPPGFSRGPTDDPRDTEVALDPDEGLDWPEVGAVRAYWDRKGATLPAGTRHLLGRPMEPGWLTRILRTGTQPARAAAAIELALLTPGKPLFALRAPGFRQARLLSGA